MKNTNNPSRSRLAHCICQYIQLQFFFIFLFWFNANLSANGTDWANGVQVSVNQVSAALCNVNGVINAQNCYQIVVTNVPSNKNPAGVEQGYSCFWHFGDGTYAMDNIAPGATQKMIRHEFRQNTIATDIYLQLTRRYDDDRKPARIIIPNNQLNGLPVRQNYFLVTTPNPGAELIPSLHPRACPSALIMVTRGK